MARVELTRRAQENLDLIFDHLARVHVSTAAAKIRDITQALLILEQSPLLGRPAPQGRRELLIGPRHNRYIAQYLYNSKLDIVFVLAIRSQRQISYP